MLTQATPAHLTPRPAQSLAELSEALAENTVNLAHALDIVNAVVEQNGVLLLLVFRVVIHKTRLVETCNQQSTSIAHMSKSAHQDSLVFSLAVLALGKGWVSSAALCWRRWIP